MKRLHASVVIIIVAVLICLPGRSDAFDWGKLFGRKPKPAPAVKAAPQKEAVPMVKVEQRMPEKLMPQIKKLDLEFVGTDRVRIDGKVVSIAEPVASPSLAMATMGKQMKARTDLIVSGGDAEGKVSARSGFQFGTIDYLGKARLRVACEDGRWNEEKERCDCYTGAESRGLSCSCPAGSMVFRLNPLIRMLLGYTTENEPRWCGCSFRIQKDGEIHHVWNALADISHCPNCLGELQPETARGDAVESGLYEGGTYMDGGQCNCPDDGPGIVLADMTCTACVSSDPNYRLVGNFDDTGNYLGVAGCGCAMAGESVPAHPNLAAVYRAGQCECIPNADMTDEGCLCKGKVEGRRCVRCEEMGKIWDRNVKKCVGCQNKWMTASADGTRCRYGSVTSGTDLGCPLYPAVDSVNHCPDVIPAFRDQCGSMVKRTEAFGSDEYANGVCLYERLARDLRMEYGMESMLETPMLFRDVGACVPVTGISTRDDGSTEASSSLQWLQAFREAVESECARVAGNRVDNCLEFFSPFEPEMSGVHLDTASISVLSMFEIEPAGYDELFYDRFGPRDDFGLDMASCNDAREEHALCYCRNGNRIEYTFAPPEVMQQPYINGDPINLFRYRVCAAFTGNDARCQLDLIEMQGQP